MDPATLLRAAKARIARTLLGGDTGVSPRLGNLTLRPHQRSAVARLLEIMSAYRGALLADAVGLGKTYVALAIAREYPSATVICPAALREMWSRAVKTAGLALPIISIESISRGVFPKESVELLIVDEAHHFRTPRTRRYQGVARLATRSRVLLLSATPLHNSRRDLTSVLALFAGSGVKEWSDGALARLIVRRDDTTAEETLPRICGPQTLSPGDDDDCLDAILALPPAVPAADEGVAQALATISLVHLWTSSRAALLASVRKRLARATALRDAVAAGHLPTASELAAWSYADGALQLVFPLFSTGAQSIDQRALNEQLDQFVTRARALIDHCGTLPDPDARRVQLLRELRKRHPDERIVAFSQYAHTISALGRLMRSDRCVAIVTGGGARIASGPLQREEILRQFSAEPPTVHPVERIDLLLTTDLLSEGIDLRGASVIVHLDLPWNPARMEQRVGRSRRLGSRQEAIHVYTFVPPAAAERIIELRRRLNEKVSIARSVVGGDFDPLGDAGRVESPLNAGEALRHRMRDWLTESHSTPSRPPVVAAAASRRAGWIAAVVVAGVARLIGDCGTGITDDAFQLESALTDLGSAVPVDGIRRDSALGEIQAWMAARDAGADAELQSTPRRAVLERLIQTVARTPRHRRAATIVVAQRTRRALAGPMNVGSESVLAELARSAVDDDAWLRSLDAFGALHANDSNHGRPREGIAAVILLEPVSSDDATPE
jgi:superfamily II DNA or RNA helicase